jgi:hypothetical protein
MNIMRYKIAVPRIFEIIIFICGIIAVQRFSLGLIGASICVIPFVLYIYYQSINKTSSSLSCLLLALVLSVDQGGTVYPETPSIIRYVIYVSILITLIGFSRLRIDERAIKFACFVGVSIVIGTISNIVNTSGVVGGYAFFRDMQVLFLLVIFIFMRRHVEFDLNLIFVGSLGYMFGEIINIIFYYTSGIEYLSYDSKKIFVLFPLLYLYIMDYKRSVKAVVMGISIVILLLYVSRMILLSVIFLLLIALLIYSLKKKKYSVYIWLFIVVFISQEIHIMDIMEGILLLPRKTYYLFVTILENSVSSNIVELFKIVDPVRYVEHELFFSRPLIEVLFGSGLGSGIIDSQGMFSFLVYDNDAFTDTELYTSIYYNFHDFWIDYGLRFGLLSVIYLIYKLIIKKMLEGEIMIGAFYGIVLLNTTFTASGLLLAAFIIRFFPEKREI